MAVNIGPQLEAMLSRYGLASLAVWLSQRITAGASPDQIELEMYDRPEFISRFPAIRIRGREGLPPLSVEEYLAYEAQAHQLGTMWGIPLNQDEINDLLAKDVSSVELEKRFEIAATAVFTTPVEDREAMFNMYGITEGELFKYWMDPKKQFPELQQQYVAARIGGAAIRSGFGDITRTQAERLYDVGLTPEQAQQGFGELYGMRQLFEPIQEGEEEITQEEQVGFLAGEADVLEKIQKRQAGRIAEFEGGGQFAAGSEGFKGIGASTS